MEFNLYKKEIKIECDVVECKYHNIQVLNNLRQKVINLCNENLNERNKTNVKAKFSGFNSLRNDKDFLDILNYINPISKKVFWSDRIVVADAWGNVYENGDFAKCHNHIGTTGFSMIIYLSEGGSGTYFNDIDLNIREEFGKVVLFSPHLFHEVSPSNLDYERITVAANIDRLEEYHQ